MACAPRLELSFPKTRRVEEPDLRAKPPSQERMKSTLLNNANSQSGNVSEDQRRSQTEQAGDVVTHDEQDGPHWDE